MDKMMGGIPKTSFYIFLVFLIQQISSLFRAFYRLVYYSSQIALVDKLSTEEENIVLG
jgi:hypothetical protein